MNRKEREILHQLSHQFFGRATITSTQFQRCLNTLIEGKNPLKIHAEFWDPVRSDPNFGMGPEAEYDLEDDTQDEEIYVVLFRKHHEDLLNPMVEANDNPRQAQEKARALERNKKSGQFYVQPVTLRRSS